MQPRARGLQSKGTRTRGAKESRCTVIGAKGSGRSQQRLTAVYWGIGSYSTGKEKEVSLDRN
jgi:hypothetical protein